MDDTPLPQSPMSAYERRRWDELSEHWQQAAARRMKPPSPATRLVRQAGGEIAKLTAHGVEVIDHAAHAAADHALGGRRVDSADAVLRVLSSVTALTARLTDPHTVIDAYAQEGISLGSLSDIGRLDLEAVEARDRHLERHWRSAGLIEGGTVGALAMIPLPVAGIAAISLDLVVVHALTIGLATHIAHTFGFDSLDPHQIIDSIAKSTLTRDAVQAEGLSEAGAAGDALVASARGWSAKLGEDPRVASATEELIGTVREGEMVSLGGAGMGIPIVGMILGAGFNQHTPRTRRPRGAPVRRHPVPHEEVRARGPRGVPGHRLESAAAHRETRRRAVTKGFSGVSGCRRSRMPGRLKLRGEIESARDDADAAEWVAIVYP